MGRHIVHQTDEARIKRLYMKQANLPGQLRRARRKIAKLEAEAMVLGMAELLSDPRYADRAFEREVAEAKRRYLGGDT